MKRKDLLNIYAAMCELRNCSTDIKTATAVIDNICILKKYADAHNDIVKKEYTEIEMQNYYDDEISENLIPININGIKGEVKIWVVEVVKEWMKKS